MRRVVLLAVVCAGCVVAQDPDHRTQDRAEMRRVVLLAVVCAGCVVAQDPNHRTQDSSESRQLLSNSYYDFLINEGSYKFWAVFQLVTVAILLYSTFAAIYYAKYTFLNEVQSSDVDDFLIRSSRSLSPFLGLEPTTFQRIIDSISSLKTR